MNNDPIVPDPQNLDTVPSVNVPPTQQMSTQVYPNQTTPVQSPTGLPNTPETPETPKKRPQMPKAVRGLLGTFQLFAGALLLAFAINAFVFQSYEVVGDSMYPTLHNGDRLIISKLGKSFSDTFGSGYVPARGDIIVFHSPNGEERQLIKRVIGLPGEKVIVKDGTITIINDENPNGFDPDIDYKDSLPADTSNEISTTVPEDSLFVAGDNRVGGSSLDSRNELGTVPIKDVVGSLVLRILPLDGAKFF